MKTAKYEIKYINLVGKEYWYFSTDHEKAKLVDAIEKDYVELVMHKIYNLIDEDDDIDDVKDKVCKNLMIDFNTLENDTVMDIRINCKMLKQKKISKQAQPLVFGFTRYMYHLLDKYGINIGEDDD